MAITDLINFLWQSYKSPAFTEVALHRYQLKLIKQRISFASIHSRFYQHEFNSARFTNDTVKKLTDISSFPIIKKSKLIKQSREEILTTAYNSKSKLRSEQSSGTSGIPFTVYFSQQEYFKRSITFLRALFMIGYCPGDKLFLLTQPHGKPTEKPWLKWYYASITESHELVANYYHQVKPDVLYGCTTSIRLLAEYLKTSGQTTLHPKAVVTTAETLDGNTRKIIEEAFQTDVFDFYGMSEVGLVAWECRSHKGYHIVEDMFYPEFIPDDVGGENQRLIITSLHQQVMPFIRFDTGDLCIPSTEQCSCGSSFKLIKSFNGRVIDSIHKANGQLVSPYSVTCALEAIPGLSRYQVVQHDLASYCVFVEPLAHHNHGVLRENITVTLKSVIANNIEINVDFVEKIEVQPGQKFRPVVSLLPRKQTEPC